MKERTKEGGQSRSRRDRRIQGRVGDAYKVGRKYSEPTMCPECSAVFHEGRWTWGTPPNESKKQRCPACQRIRDKAPAGSLEIGGPFFEAHREEILNLARNEETLEKEEHPLNRIMGIEEKGKDLVITTTDVHLPSRIGKALQHSYQGGLAIHFGEEADFFRASWRR